MIDSPIQHVSDTAIWVATYRAIETERSDALFRDPLAKRLVGERGPKIASKMLASPWVNWSVIIRTCIIDRYISAALEQGVDTVLNLGAGLDTRPYRMSLPRNLRWIEVDHRQIIDHKTDQLKNETPGCQLERVTLDLSDRSSRRRFLSEVNSKATKVLVITEGVIPYLSTEETATLAADLRAQPRFQLWIVDYFSPESMKYLQRKRTFRNQMRLAPFRFEVDDWFGFFEKQGWRVKELRYLGEEADALKRPMTGPWWINIVRWFAPSRILKKFKRMTGYALLEVNS